MFFYLSKALGFFLLPANLFIVLAIVGIVLMATRYRRTGAWLTLAAIALFTVGGFAPAGLVLENVLENRFPRWDPGRGAPDGVIVLGGAINPVISRLRGDVALTESAERVTAIARLARAYPRARFVFTGGDFSLSGKAGAEADYLYPLLDSFGIARERVQLESRARNTAENAAFAKEIAKPKPGERWLLVTSAFHMPRAVGAFRRAGFPVEAYPVDWHTPPRPSLQLGTDLAGGLDQLDRSVHEWIGLFVYWITGRTTALFPAP